MRRGRCGLGGSPSQTRLAPGHWCWGAGGAGVLVVLAACGGGGDSDGGAGPAPAVLTLTGTAAKGAALAGAQIEAKCVGGSLNGTAEPNGSYTLVLPEAAALPCVLKATDPADLSNPPLAYYSVATGSGRSARANITPVTTLAVAHMAAGPAEGYFSAFDASAPPNNVAAAQTAAAEAVVATLLAAGVDLSSAGDVFAVPLVAGSASDAYDRALDALQAKLAETGVSLNALADGVVANVNPLITAPNEPVASLPAALLLRPQASTCDALRSGTYVSIDSESVYPESSYPGFPAVDVAIDAATLTYTDVTIGESGSLVPVAGARCRYTLGDGVGSEPDAEVTVSGAGVMLVRWLTENVNGTWHGSVLIPQQSHTLAELVGEWNLLGFEQDGGGRPFLQNATATIDAGGSIRNLTTCVVSSGACTTEAHSDSVMVSDGQGAFFLNSPADGSRRASAYRAGSGELMLVLVKANGALSFATRKAAQVLPVLNSASQGWQVRLQPNAVEPWFTAPLGMSHFQNTVTALDPALQRYTRSQVVDVASGVTRPETIVLNSPRAGFRHRLAATGVLHSDGSTGNVAAWEALPLRGMGVSALGITGNNELLLSAGQAQ